MTAKLHIHSSPRLEDLFEHFSAVLESGSVDPLATQTVIVPSQGVARWLQLRWARRWGLAAGFDYLFPGQWARRLGRRLGIDASAPTGSGTDEDPFDTPALSLRIYEELGPLATDFAELEAYLGPEADARRRQQLAARLARHFGEWQLYRPDVLRDWGQGRPSPGLEARFRHEPWLGELWRRLADESSPAMALGDLLLELRDRLRAAAPADVAQLEPVYAFGIGSLPPLLLQLIRGVAEHREARIYFPAPTRAYWTGVRSQRSAQRDELREPTVDYTVDESLPSLLADFGRQGRDFFSMLVDLDEDGQSWEPVGEEADRPPRTLLESLQAEVVGGEVEHEEGVLDLARDRSLRLHACHSPRRELEVLRDELWRAFAEEDDLVPGDVLVLVRDMRSYAPFVRAVFDEEIDGAPHIPYSLADRRWQDEEPLVRAFLQLLELGRARRSATQILDLLDCAAVAARFDLDDAELVQARELVRRMGIRWGSDPEQRARDWRLPVFEGASWREGLDAALFGGLTGELEGPVAGVRVAGDVATDRLDLSARLSRFLRELDGLWESLRGEATLSVWCRRAAGALDRFFLPREDAQSEVLAGLRRQLGQLEALADTCGLKAPWSVEAFLAVLEERLESSGPTLGFLSGSVTFAELRPLRSLPFRVLAMLGLDEDTFPRQLPRDSLDLLALERRRGDRSPAEDDRYLFLETLMAARERLHLSAVARSERDGSDRGRSLVLDELGDVLRRRLGDGSQEVERRHALHSFHPDYFSGARGVRSFDRAAARLARTVESPRHALPPFFEGVELERELPREIALADLEAFYRDPAKWFCRRVLELNLRDEDELEDTEALELGGLDRWRVGDAMLRLPALPPPPARWWSLERELGLAHTTSSQLRLEEAAVEGLRLRGWIEEMRPLADVEVAVQVAQPGAETVQVTGRLRGFGGQGLVSASVSRASLRDTLLAALRLGLLQAAGESPLRLRHRARDEEILLEVNESNDSVLREWLQKAVEVYRRAHRRPLFVPWALAGTFQKWWVKYEPESPVTADLVRRFFEEGAAASEWEGSDFHRGVLADEAWTLLLGPRPDPEPVIADLGAHFDTLLRPLQELDGQAKR